MVQFEPMSVGRIYDVAFNLYRRNFLRFIVIVAIVQVPVGLLSVIRNAAMSSSASTRSAEQSDAETNTGTYPARYGNAGSPSSGQFMGIIAGTLIGAVITVVGNMLSQAALIKNISETYLGNEVTVGNAYKFVLPKLLTLIGASLLVGLVVGVGFLLLVVPGVIFSLWYALTVPSVVVEKHTVTSAMSRSKNLVAGNLGKVFVVVLLATILSFVIGMVLGLVGTIGSMAVSAGSAGGNSHLALFISQGASVVAQILAAPIAAAAYVLLYYDLRIRKEGFDLEMLAESMQSNSGEIATDGSNALA